MANAEPLIATYVRYGLFVFQQANMYRKEDAIRLYVNEKVARRAATKMDPDYTKNIVVRRVEWSETLPR